MSDNVKRHLPLIWIFDTDGETVNGLFREFIAAHTCNSGKVMPVLILEVEGRLRSIYCQHAALQNRLHEELETRSSGEFDQDEKITISRGGMVQSQSHADRKYRAYDVEFS